MDQFEQLLASFGGPTERRRWREELLPRIEVYEAAGDEDGASEAPGASSSSSSSSRRSDSPGAAGGAPGGGGAGPAPQARLTFRLPRAIARLQQQQQRGDVFGLGLALEAVTLTANSNAVRHLAEQRVALEAVVHRPVWLTGL